MTMWDHMALLGQSEDTRYALIGVLVLVGGIFVIIWMISFAVRSADKHQHPQQPPVPPQASPPPPDHAFPVKMIAPADGPGTFRVAGVDRDTGMDVVDHIAAESAANARVKAELRGIVVTGIDRV